MAAAGPPEGRGAATTAEEHLVAAMDAAGLPGAKVAEMLRDLGPGRALMSGSAVLHAIISAEGGGPPDWTPGGFDIYYDDSIELLKLSMHRLKDSEHLDVEVICDGPHMTGNALERVNRIIGLRGGAGEPILTFNSWSASRYLPGCLAAPATFTPDFTILRSTFDGSAIDTPPEVAAAIRERTLCTDEPLRYRGTETVSDLAARLVKYHGRGFSGLPDRIDIGPVLALHKGLAEGPLPDDHVLAAMYVVEEWGSRTTREDYMAGGTLRRITGRATKASRA